ncbi:hypothetical protein [Streptomyces sp. NPDC056512]
MARFFDPLTSPIFGSFSRPLPVLLQRALALNLMDWRESPCRT